MSALLLTAEQVNSWVGLVLWPLFRIAGLFAIVPVLGGGEVPMRVRVGLASLITVLIVPSLAPMPELDPLSLTSLMITLQQILIGVAMGLFVLIVFNAITMAGEAIAVTMGLGFALMNDPQNGAQSPTVSQFYRIMATLLFLALDGHHAILMLMNNSFTYLPVGIPLGQDAIWILLRWGGVIFYGALTIALPALAAMLTVNITMGVITRAAPQLNLFSIGFPITLSVGFIAIYFTFPAFQFTFSSLFEMTKESISQFLVS